MLHESTSLQLSTVNQGLVNYNYGYQGLKDFKSVFYYEIVKANSSKLITCLSITLRVNKHDVVSTVVIS